jgi:hypothetical protein
MKTGLTAGGGMALGMIVGIIFDSLVAGDEHRGLVLGMVLGLAFGAIVAGLRRAGSSGPSRPTDPGSQDRGI